MRGVDPRLRDLFRLYEAKRLDVLFKLELPWALPSIATGFRVASGLAVIGAIVGEFVAGFSEGHAGLGITILAAYRQLRTDLLFAAVVLSSLLGLGLFAAVNLGSSFILRRFRAAP
jgi:NitT/TauT family transport system permease protein